MDLSVGRHLLLITLFALCCAPALGGTCYLTHHDPFPPQGGNSGAALSVVAVGTSVMWGDGLDEDHTFRYLVAKWLSDQTGRAVDLWTFAHSASYLTEITGKGKTAPDPSDGDLNGNYPAISEQIDCAASGQYLLGKSDLVLVDGCFNEVGAESVVNPATRTDDIVKRVDTYCYQGLKDVLAQAESSFPNATIAVAAYFPIVSSKSTIFGSSGTHRLAQYAKQAEQADTSFVQPQGPIVPLSRSEEKNIMVKNSEVFYQDSKTDMQKAIQELNSIQPPRIYFAKLPEIDVNGVQTIDPNFAYAAPRTQEWLIPFWFLGPHNPDEKFLIRRKACLSDYSPGTDELTCESNAGFHPDVQRAISYANSIEHVIPSSLLESWKNR